ncbi:hypothetical protein NG799_25670 [Laspinema sp. D1]|uniref:Uncharacterized protein n=1 Tax=Laspinema palackyanum D2a TaxID=2953684 RepID=A0ABT2N0D2_9CYAN|nr:hypothetical protein [Laspinema sp. D2a]
MIDTDTDAKVNADGKLVLQIPLEFANQELEIVIHEVAEETTPTPEELGYPADFFEQTAGKWQGPPLGREELVECDRRIWDGE